MNLDSFLNIERNFKRDQWIYEFNKTSNDYIGNNASIDTIRNWLLNPSDKTGLIIHGPTGSGKTSLIQMLCNENKIINYFRDSTNKRSKKDLCLYYEEIQSFKDCVLIMDEMDMIISGEHMGLSEIKNWVKNNNENKNSIRIVFIILSIYLNKLSDLFKLCDIAEMVYPSSVDFTKKCKSINKKVTKKDLSRILDVCKNEPRSVFCAVKSNITCFTNETDKEYNMYDTYSYAINCKHDLQERYRLFYNECGTIPIIIQENYLDWNVSYETKHRICEYMAVADIFHKEAFSVYNEHNVDMYATMSVLLPSVIAYKDNPTFCPKKDPRFGLVWTKQSAMFQKRKYIQNMEMNMTHRAEIDIHFVYDLRKDIEKCIENNDANGINKIMVDNGITKTNVLELFNIFNFTKKDTDFKKTLKNLL